MPCIGAALRISYLSIESATGFDLAR